MSSQTSAVKLAGYPKVDKGMAVFQVWSKKDSLWVITNPLPVKMVLDAKGKNKETVAMLIDRNGQSLAKSIKDGKFPETVTVGYLVDWLSNKGDRAGKDTVTRLLRSIPKLVLPELEAWCASKGVIVVNPTELNQERKNKKNQDSLDALIGANLKLAAEDEEDEDSIELTEDDLDEGPAK